ncbi:MAG TPA: hypothetical protein VKE74_05905 [Gemmataceae bacterium]|nr:hypothetical protein [Gemmataceae bacterium]
MRASRWVTAVVLGVGMLALVQAQPGGGFGFGGGGPVQLVAIKAVQEELKMTDDQIAKVMEWSKEEGGKLQAMRKEKLADLDFKSEEGRAKLLAFNAESTKTAYADLEKSGVLKPEQIKRLKQLDRQRQGVRAFADPDVVAALKLTDDQKTKIKGITDEYTKESAAISQEYGLGFGGFKGKDKGTGKFDPAKAQEGQKKLDGLQTATVGKIVDLLTADQKVAWKDMVGDAFDTSKLRPTFGGGKGKGKGD